MAQQDWLLQRQRCHQTGQVGGVVGRAVAALRFVGETMASRIYHHDIEVALQLSGHQSQAQAHVREAVGQYHGWSVCPRAMVVQVDPVRFDGV